jgi:hypothetical protein
VRALAVSSTRSQFGTSVHEWIACVLPEPLPCAALRHQVASSWRTRRMGV